MSRNESKTRLDLIDPQLKVAGWGMNKTVGSNILPEHVFTDGRLIGTGQRGKQKKADYLLVFNSQKLAIVEAKAEDREVTDGLEQVKDYAKCLNIRFVYSTNGKGIYLFDMKAGTGREVEGYHRPEELFEMTFGELNEIEKTVISEPFQREKYGPRYYQENAINSAVKAVSGGEDRVLLTLATGKHLLLSRLSGSCFKLGGIGEVMAVDREYYF